MTLIAAAVCDGQIACVSDTMLSSDAPQSNIITPTSAGARFLAGAKPYSIKPGRKLIRISDDIYIYWSGLVADAMRFATSIIELNKSGICNDTDLNALCDASAEDLRRDFSFMSISTLSGAPQVHGRNLRSSNSGSTTYFAAGSGAKFFLEYNNYARNRIKIRGIPDTLLGYVLMFGTLSESFQSTNGFELENRWGGGFEYLSNERGKLILEDNICTQYVSIFRHEGRIAFFRKQTWTSFQFYHENCLIKTDVSHGNPAHAGFQISSPIYNPSPFPPQTPIHKQIGKVATVISAHGSNPMMMLFDISDRTKAESTIDITINGREMRWTPLNPLLSRLKDVAVDYFNM